MHTSARHNKLNVVVLDYCGICTVWSSAIPELIRQYTARKIDYKRGSKMLARSGSVAAYIAIEEGRPIACRICLQLHKL